MVFCALLAERIERFSDGELTGDVKMFRVFGWSICALCGNDSWSVSIKMLFLGFIETIDGLITFQLPLPVQGFTSRVFLRSFANLFSTESSPSAGLTVEVQKTHFDREIPRRTRHRFGARGELHGWINFDDHYGQSRREFFAQNWRWDHPDIGLCFVSSVPDDVSFGVKRLTAF